MTDSARITAALACACLLLAATANAAQFRGLVVDRRDGRPVAARVYLRHLETGRYYLVRSLIDAPAAPYDKTNWINKRSVEKHTTVPAGPFGAADLPAGRYELTVVRGKEYAPETRELELGDTAADVVVRLRRWVNMAELGWYSGETHVHRSLDELPLLVEAEDLNVALPLTYWVTQAGRTAAEGDKNAAGPIPETPIVVDDRHVIWPRNTEYEISRVGGKRHTLGALFVLGHRTPLDLAGPPWGPIGERARAEGALLDMDKLDWPFAMTLPHITGATLYELANNHMWRTEFAFRRWNSWAPPFLRPPAGGREGGEWDWVRYTLGMYYTLLDAGFPLVPAAGTASGVHPVPLGFSRVYVHLPDGFSYQAWMEGLAAGRSFVTNGPMLLVRVNDQPPGAVFHVDQGPARLRVAGEVLSLHRLAFLEILANGRVVRTVRPRQSRTTAGAVRSSFAAEVELDGSGWLCVRAFEDRPDGKPWFAHTAPWRVDIPGRRLTPTSEEQAYLVRRVEDELARSQGVLPPEAIAEYEAARERFQRLETQPDDLSEARPPRDDADLRRWLENMVWHHRFTVDEVRRATGLSRDAIQQAMARWDIRPETRPRRSPEDPLLVLPYPGGRHPRIGFLDGAIRPQRDTKLSVFAPWGDQTDYVVVDLPEAIWSNLGLTYLAHTHVPTIWEAEGVTLPKLEWRAADGGGYQMRRELPNGVVFGARAKPKRDELEMELWITNGTDQTLTKLRAQICVMLKGAEGFNAQCSANKLVRDNRIFVRGQRGGRWIMTAWTPAGRVWHNPATPCIHSDPALPDCPPGDTVRARGVLRFGEGEAN